MSRQILSLTASKNLKKRCFKNAPCLLFFHLPHSLSLLFFLLWLPLTDFRQTAWCRGVLPKQITKFASATLKTSSTSSATSLTSRFSLQCPSPRRSSPMRAFSIFLKPRNRVHAVRQTLFLLRCSSAFFGCSRHGLSSSSLPARSYDPNTE